MPTDATPHQPPNQRSRLGFHYYPDTLHYRESDLLAWLPELQAMGAAWLTLFAPADRAIPEPFLQGLLKAGVEPILHFHLPFACPTDESALELLFNVYASWGVRYVVLFDRPNLRDSWPASAWAQSELVERFLDIFLPVANRALQAGLTPVFPPLEPGGDYWDTCFLQASLQGMLRRGQTALLDALHLGAYARVDGHPVEWGAGGPERWPGVRPYFTPQEEQDQLGFYIFDWYLTHTQAALGTPRPILLLAAGQGLKTSSEEFASEAQEQDHAAANLAIAQRLGSTAQSGEGGEPISPYVLACNFWLLAADPAHPQASQAWFQSDGYTLPVVDALRQLANQGAPLPGIEATDALDPLSFALDAFPGVAPAEVTSQEPPPPPADAPEAPDVQDPVGGDAAADTIPAGAPVEPAPETPVEEPVEASPVEMEQPSEPGSEQAAPSSEQTSPVNGAEPPAHLPIAHYLLLPLPDSGAAEWLLEAARPFILKYHPTLGYSPEEAALARCITLVGGEQPFPETLLAALRNRGCTVTRITGDGTEIATQLATL
jgi:hypothetical protein